MVKYEVERTVLRDRLMVGRLTLDQEILGSNPSPAATTIKFRFLDYKTDPLYNPRQIMTEVLRQVEVRGCGRIKETPHILEGGECFSLGDKDGSYPNWHIKSIQNTEDTPLICVNTDCMFHDSNKSKMGEIIRPQIAVLHLEASDNERLERFDYINGKLTRKS